MISTQTPIGFIGLGVMGNSMASRILEGGFPLHIYTRTKEKAKNLIEKGAIWHDSPKTLAESSHAIITIVGFPMDVEDIYLSDNGLIHHAKRGTYLIDMTTSSPSLAVRLYDEGKKRGLHVLDAPVSGGDIGAREGRLSIMVGGDEEDFQHALPLFKMMGTNIVHQGGPGKGQHTKMANQIAIATNMIGVCESLVYANRTGLDVEKVLQSISTGAAASFSLSAYAPRILAGDFSPGFFIKHFIKDMKIALEEAEKLGLDLPGLALAKRMYSELAELGEENSGTQALYKYWESY